MNIEVTSETFWKLFTQDDFTSVENLEHGVKTFFYNEGINQRGIAVKNFVSTDIIQYYLTDINA